MEIAKPPCLRGTIRLQHAVPTMNVEEPLIVWYDVNATMIYEREQLLLKFSFRPDNYHDPVFFENAVNEKTDEEKPHVREAQLFRTAKHEYVLYGCFVLTNVYGEEIDSWEMVGKFRGLLPKEIACWDCVDTIG